MQWEGFFMRRKPNRTYDAAMDAAIIFRPAITPIEAAALPAREARERGALHHAKAAWQLDGTPGRRAPGRARLGGWHLQRQNI